LSNPILLIFQKIRMKNSIPSAADVAFAVLLSIGNISAIDQHVSPPPISPRFVPTRKELGKPKIK